MASILQAVAKNVRDSVETLEELKLAADKARDEANEAHNVFNEKQRLLLIAQRKVTLQEEVLASYLTDAHDISVAGLERIGR